MAERANISPSFRWRLALVAAFCFGLALWSVYDGSVKYPNERERYHAYQQLKKQDQLDQWEEIAAEHGWPTEKPAKPHGEEEDTVQFIMAGMATPVGLLFLYFFLRNRGRWIEGDENGLHTSWNQQLQFDQITVLDKKRWRKKGIAVVRYEQEGRKRRLVLDDCKYDPQPIEVLLRLVESHVSPEQVVGGQLPQIIIDEEPDEAESRSEDGAEATPSNEEDGAEAQTPRQTEDADRPGGTP